MTFRTRFAPSPTGPLHLGHAYSALLAYDMAQSNGGTFLLRIEDIDHTRSRPEWEELISFDLAWLGIKWPTPALRQSTQLDRYQSSLKTLWDQGLLYECSCNRKDILNAMSAPQESFPIGPDGIIYPGTCRPIHPHHPSPMPDGVLRLNMKAALDKIRGPLAFLEKGTGPNGETGLQQMSKADAVEQIGDIVLSRKGLGTSYHLSVVLDDAWQQVTHVVRGQDLFEATMVHVILQRLLNLTSPQYHHHSLIRDDAGKRLAKRDDAKAISVFREDGASPSDIRNMVGLG